MDRVEFYEFYFVGRQPKPARSRSLTCCPFPRRSIQSLVAHISHQTDYQKKRRELDSLLLFKLFATPKKKNIELANKNLTVISFLWGTF